VGLLFVLNAVKLSASLYIPRKLMLRMRKYLEEDRRNRKVENKI